MGQNDYRIYSDRPTLLEIRIIPRNNYTHAILLIYYSFYAISCLRALTDCATSMIVSVTKNSNIGIGFSGDGWFYDFGDSNRAFKRDCTVYTGY